MNRCQAGIGLWWAAGRKLAAGLAGLWLLTAPLGAAERRFPPPDFETGYTFPEETYPAARALAMHYVDIVVLVAALGLASWLILKRRSRRGVAALSIGSMLYFGFYRKGCVCAIGSIQNVALSLFDSSYALPLTILVFFVAPLVTALFFGRSFCAAVCPHGALQDLVLVRPVRVPRWLEQGLGVLPFVYLGMALVFAATGSAFIICRWDPFVPLFRLSGPLKLILLGVGFVVLGMFVGRPYCRFLCPYGALLRLAAVVSRWKVRITPDHCTQCRLCEDACPYGVIREPVGLVPQGQELASERTRFLLLCFLLPVLVAGGGWLGSRFMRAQAVVNSQVGLAEQYLSQAPDADQAGLATPDKLALARAQRERATLLPFAVEKRNDLAFGGWFFGGFIGLVVGCKLVGFSFWRRRSDYEPDQGGCFGCARCFLSCPQERVRLGLMAPEDAPTGPVEHPLKS